MVADPSTERLTSPPLRLVPSGPALPCRSGGAPELALRPTPHLRRFLATAAEYGLAPGEAVRLGLEHQMALEDLEVLRVERGALRAILAAMAARARPSRGLADADADRVRRLVLASPLPEPELTGTLTFALPPRLWTRLEGLLSPELLDYRAVGEMIAWERAAILTGRTMGEWAFASALSGVARGLAG
jgi:hypothetical protein